MFPLWQLTEYVLVFLVFLSVWVLIYSTVNSNKYNPHFKNAMIFKSLKESWGQKVCEGLLYGMIKSNFRPAASHFLFIVGVFFVFKEP